jgi:hypothetical protein
MLALSRKAKRVGRTYRTNRATLEDVARAAGVAPMTVSRTINGHPYVAEETANRVRAAIRRFDYRPNHAARILTGQLSRSIGVIVPDIADTSCDTVDTLSPEVYAFFPGEPIFTKIGIPSGLNHS